MLRRISEMWPTRRIISLVSTLSFIAIVFMVNLGFLKWSSRNVREVCIEGGYTMNEERSADLLSGFMSNDDYNASTSTGINIMVHARMRTGSSLMADCLNVNPEVFYVYEPGFILNRFRRDIWDDSWMFLEDMRVELTQFIDGVYSCNFTGNEYFINSMNEVSWMRQLTRTEFLTKVNERGITNVCKYRKHKLIKNVRLNNLIMAAPVLKEHNVKVIQMVRDPRGMSSSRTRLQIYAKRKKNVDRDAELEKIDDIVKNYCVWLETNYLSVKYGPDWLKRNYRLVRFEDLVSNPSQVVEELYEFVGLAMTDTVKQKIREMSKKKSQSPESWRYKTGPEIIKRAQDVCPERIFRMFGYRLITKGTQLTDKDFSTITSLPENTESSWN
ncbi:carbohydrate sulfotransferase 1-like [Ptychodera flava]|uniref:carbohydrate sulfotransferase 1-like n=1 Tax=Ptychodera flava TaxID=63121 RepID=UPI00396A9907